jgi:transcriptional regulator with GAF, ATPase, and Fis domain
MEEMQAAIKNASELSAEEAAKQTALAQAIEKNSHQAATAAKATAYHTRQIDKNTRRFR